MGNITREELNAVDQRKDVPYIIYREDKERQELRDKRDFKVKVFLIIALLVTNLAWMWMFNQYDITSETVTVESTDSANANYMGAQASGVINNGSKSDREAEDND